MALTGDAASWGEMSLKGAQLAVADLNKKGGINGKKIELVTEDMKSTSQGAISAVQKLVSLDGVNAILGPSWLDVYQGAQGVTGKNLIMISPDAGIEAVNGEKLTPNVFSVWYRSQPKADLVMKFLAGQGVKRLAIVHQNDSYYVDLGKRLQDTAGKYGITIVRHEITTSGETDFKTMMLKLKQDNPDMVFFSFYDQKSLDAFLNNRAQLFPTVPIITDEAGQDYSENSALTKLIDGLYYLGVRPDPAFAKEFQETYSVAPKFGASTGYDGLMVLVEAIKNQPDDLVGYVKTHTFKTVTFGDMKFDDINGVTTNNEMYVVKQFKDGKVTILK